MLEEIRGHDAILLGAVGGKPGDPNLPPGILERGLLLRLRFELDHYVNLRPSRIFPGVVSPLADPGEVDFVVVREGTEGPYTGNGGALRVGTPAEVATEVSVNTAYGVERVVRDAFARAQRRPRGKLTLVHKTNVLVHAGAVWSRIVGEVAAEFPEVTVDYLHIDAAMIFMTTDPARFDVIVTDNLFGDIITDLAAAITGGIGLAASRQHQPRPHRAVDVRAGPRLRARHRRSAEGRPDRGDPLGRRCCSTTSASTTRPPRSRSAVARRPGRPQQPGAHRGVPPRSATPSPPASPADAAAPPVALSADALPAWRHRPVRRVALDRPRERWATVPPMADHHHALDDPATTRGSPRSWPTPASGPTSPTTCSPPSGPPSAGWHDARITPYGPLTLDPATAVLHYAQEIFEGIKAYRHADGSVWTFRPEANAAADGPLLPAARPARC